MMTADPTGPAHAEPPRMLPRDPRPGIDTLRKWPFVLLGTAALGVLASLTVLPALWSESGPEPPAEPPPARLGEPRGLRGMPTDYTQVERPAPQPPALQPADSRLERLPEPREAPGYQEARSTGPTRAELLKAARMANLAPVGIGGGTAQAGAGAASAPVGSGGGRPSGKLYNPHSLTPASECQIDAGTNIPAMTEQRLTSESPGTVSALVSRDVWSSDKTCLAIPRGTRFVGKYQTAVSEGQVRMGILWTGLTRPPPRGDTLELADTVAGDPDGTAGVTGEVNNHFWRKLAYVTASSLLDIGKTAITANGEGGVATAIGSIFANRAASPVDDWARRQLDIPPVIEVEPREISIVLAQHLAMDEFRSTRL